MEETQTRWRSFYSLSLTFFLYHIFTVITFHSLHLLLFCLFIVDILPAHFQLLRSCVLQWLTSDRWLDVVSLFISFLIWFQSEQRVVIGNVVLVCSFFSLFHLKLSVITEFELEYHCWLLASLHVRLWWWVDDHQNDVGSRWMGSWVSWRESY